MKRSERRQAADSQRQTAALVLYAGEQRRSAGLLESLHFILDMMEEQIGGTDGAKIGLALSPAWFAQAESCEASGASEGLAVKLRKLQKRGAVELLAYPSAHLPLLRKEETVYAQLASAVREHELRFGTKPRGVLLPGGGFTLGIDRLLRELGADYAIAGANAALFAVPKTEDAGLEPLVTPYGVVLLPAVREGGVVTAELGSQEAVDRLHELQESSGLWVTPAELADAGRARFRISLPAEASWEPDGGAAAWLQDGSAPLLRHLHEAEARMIELARRHANQASKAMDHALRSAAQALHMLQEGSLLREAGDGLRTAIAVQRFQERWRRFDEACRLAESGDLAQANPAALAKGVDPWPGIDWRDFVPRGAGGTAEADVRELIRRTSGRANIVMLAWEYPPKQVGGLACAVCDLAESLAAQGHVVHVVTTTHGGTPPLETVRGVHVHRVSELSSGPTDFYHWTFEWNLAIVDYLVRWKELGGRIDILHAHDWIVFHAARELKISCGIPLVATIHATEWGRHQGRLHSELQRSIHGLECRLAFEASKVLVCSEYMRSEVMRLFELPADKVHVFPNGVQLDEIEESGNAAEAERAALEAAEERRRWAADGERILFFIGRLVYEKGLQTLLEAMPSVWAQMPLTKLIVAGSGPMEDEWRRMSAPYGDRIHFVGHADAALKERLYRAADVVVIPSWYEPFGIVALEAMKFGTPVVISDTGGLAEIVEHGVDGFKALPGHAESLAWHTAELLLRPELGRRMSEKAAGKLKERYAWPGIAAEVASLYRELTPLG